MSGGGDCGGSVELRGWRRCQGCAEACWGRWRGEEASPIGCARLLEETRVRHRRVYPWRWLSSEEAARRGAEATTS